MTESEQLSLSGKSENSLFPFPPPCSWLFGTAPGQFIVTHTLTPSTMNWIFPLHSKVLRQIQRQVMTNSSQGGLETDDIDIGKGVMTRVDVYETNNVLLPNVWTAHKSHIFCWYFVLEVSRSLSEAVRRAFSTFSCNASETLSVPGGDGWGHLPLWNFLSNRWQLFCSTRICFSNKFKCFIARFLSVGDFASKQQDGDSRRRKLPNFAALVIFLVPTYFLFSTPLCCCPLF